MTKKMDLDKLKTALMMKHLMLAQEENPGLSPSISEEWNKADFPPSMTAPEIAIALTTIMSQYTENEEVHKSILGYMVVMAIEMKVIHSTKDKLNEILPESLRDQFKF